jgi:hypothetical protein
LVSTLVGALKTKGFESERTDELRVQSNAGGDGENLKIDLLLGTVR